MQTDDQDAVARLAQAEQAAADGEVDRAIELLAGATELLSSSIETHASDETSTASRRRLLTDDLAAVERALRLAATWESATRAELVAARHAERFTGPQSDPPGWIHERA